MPYFFQKLRKMSQNLSTAAVVIGALRVDLSSATPKSRLWYSKTCLKGPLKKKTKIGFQISFQIGYRIMQVKSIAECSKIAFCNTLDLHLAKLDFLCFSL